jgi:hypothetical protein
MSEPNIPRPWPRERWSASAPVATIPSVIGFINQRTLLAQVVARRIGTIASIAEDVYRQLAQPSSGYPILDNSGRPVDAYYPQLARKPSVAEDVYRQRYLSVAE